MRLLLSATIGSVLAGLSSTSAWALEVPYSQGFVTIDDTKSVTVGAGGDYATCDLAFKAFPTGGNGGVITFLPGEHVSTCGSIISSRGNILITGQLGPNGERPRVTTPLVLRSSGSVDKHPFIQYTPKANDNLIIENLEIFDTQGIDVSNMGGVVIRNVHVNGTRTASGIAGRKPSVPVEYEQWIEVYDTEVNNAGSNNQRHNLYINRIDRFYADNLYTHSADNSHALKTVARSVTVINSKLATTNIPFDELKADEFSLSGPLLDYSACSQSVVRNNTFVGFHLHKSQRPGGYGGTTSSFIDLRRRRGDVAGCDMPVPESDTYNDPAFWQAAAEKGYSRDNEALFHHDISGNTFINEGNRGVYSVRNLGTRTVYGAAGPDEVEPPLPKGWFERSVAWLENNVKQGSVLSGKDWNLHENAPIFDFDGGDVVELPPVEEEPEPTVDDNPGEVIGGGTSVPQVSEASGLLIFAAALSGLCGLGAIRRKKQPLRNWS